LGTRWKNVGDIPARGPLDCYTPKVETNRENTPIPQGFFVMRLPAKVARGASKARSSGSLGGQLTTGQVPTRTARDVTRAMAARGASFYRSNPTT
jgi:hypothetical protein